MPLYEVQVTALHVVFAESREAAAERALLDAACQLAASPSHVVIRELRGENAIPRGWAHRIPYGEHSRRTCAQIVKVQS